MSFITYRRECRINSHKIMTFVERKRKEGGERKTDLYTLLFYLDPSYSLNCTFSIWDHQHRKTLYHFYHTWLVPQAESSLLKRVVNFFFFLQKHASLLSICCTNTASEGTITFTSENYNQSTPPLVPPNVIYLAFCFPVGLFWKDMPLM